MFFRHGAETLPVQSDAVDASVRGAPVAGDAHKYFVDRCLSFSVEQKGLHVVGAPGIVPHFAKALPAFWAILASFAIVVETYKGWLFRLDPKLYMLRRIEDAVVRQ